MANHYKIQIIMLEPKQNSLFIILNVNNIQNHVTLNSNKESLVETAPNKLKCIILIQGSYTQAYIDFQTRWILMMILPLKPASSNDKVLPTIWTDNINTVLIKTLELEHLILLQWRLSKKMIKVLLKLKIQLISHRQGQKRFRCISQLIHAVCRT